MRTVWAITGGFWVMMILSIVMCLVTMSQPPLPAKAATFHSKNGPGCDCEMCRRRHGVRWR
jgi:hypothetical protein